MKKIIFIISLLLISQVVFATEYPPGKDSLIKEFGQKYYELREQLPYDDAGDFFYDEALRKKAECLAILLRLLNDKTITSKKINLFESLNVNSSDVVFDENKFIINAIIGLLMAGYEYNSVPQAMSDDFRKFRGDDKILMKQMIDKKISYYSIFYQSKSSMSKYCADIFAKHIYETDNLSKEQNEEYLKAFENAIENGCIDIGIISHYVDVIIKDGKYNNKQTEAANRVMGIYNKYFDKFSNKDLQEPTMLYLFQRLTYLNKGKDNDRIQSDINKKIAQLISDDKVKLKDQPQWIRKGYLRLLTNSVKTQKMNKNKNINTSIDAVTDANNTEAIKILKNTFEKKGNVFVLPNDKRGAHYEELTKEEKEFLKMIEN